MNFIFLMGCRFFLFACTFCSLALAQSPAESTDPLITLLEASDYLAEEEIDSLLQFNYQSIKYDLNKVKPDQLDSLGSLTVKQIENFFQYRKSFGPFLDIHELQAIPLWDLTTIARVRSRLTLLPMEWYQLPLSFNNPMQSLLTIRWRPPAPNHSEANSLPSWSGDAHYLRLTYRYSTSFLKVGITTEKDPGELWISKHTKLPADFLSTYIMLVGKGKIKQLILGDYTVNLAQGLIHWQAMSFRKTPQLTLLKKGTAVFQPHRSNNEFNFHRGIALQFQWKPHNISLFMAAKRLSGNIGYLAAENQFGITSFNTSGYHRTAAEIKNQGNLSQFVAGGRYSFKKGMFSSGVNFIFYQFSLPLIPTSKPYDLFAIKGKNWNNLSVDIGYTYKNFHLFMEQALDKNGSIAGLVSVLTSLTKTIDFGLLGRYYSKSFQSLYSNAVAEGTRPANEQGFFFSMNARISNTISAQLFADHFYFPWIRYLIDQPSRGQEHFIQLNYQPDKVSTIYLRLKQEQKMQTVSDEVASAPLEPAYPVNRFNFRLQVERSSSQKFKWAVRMETSRIKKLVEKSAVSESGFLGFVQFNFRFFAKKAPKGVFRFLIFDTDGYQSRIYAFTPQTGGSFQLGQYSFSGKELLLSVENELLKIISFQSSITCTQKGNSDNIQWCYSIQIALKLHELATPKIYSTF
ncbi:MAG: helix-hairpin-helix domain-containing protein [Bacteroidetes bacterium]|nr:helix-hairpin-helix domain-containing protein [Bacteroidota bacterium]